MQNSVFNRYFTLWSTQASIIERRISLLALLETAIATAIYIALNYYFETYFFYFSAIVLAPFVLIRSDKSVQLGAEAFNEYLEYKSDIRLNSTRRLLAILAGAAASIMSWYFFQPLAASQSSWPQTIVFATFFIWIAANIGAAVMTVIAREIVDASGDRGALLFLVFCAIGYLIGISLRALLTRWTASTIFLKSGLSQIPVNWFRVVAVTDLADLPEMVPGIAERRKNAGLRGFVWEARQERTFQPFYVVGIPILFLPALLYRWSLKATWWFWLPLVFLAGARVRASDADWRAHWLQTDKKLVEWIGVILAALSLTVAIISAIDPGRLQALISAAGLGEPVINAFSVFYILDWSSLYPWQYLTLPSTLLTIGLFLWIDSLAKDARVNPGVYDGWQLRLAAFLRQVRALCVIAWLAIAFAYTIGFVHRQCDLPQWAGWLDRALDQIDPVSCPPPPQ